jgi:hypothetical protein
MREVRFAFKTGLHRKFCEAFKNIRARACPDGLQANELCFIDENHVAHKLGCSCPRPKIPAPYTLSNEERATIRYIPKT